MELTQVTTTIKERVDLVALIGRYVELEPAGNEWRGFCPFHSDRKTKSFYVNPEKGVWHCFGCGASGDAITFLQKIEGLSFKEALARLGEEVDVEVDRRGGLTVEALAQAKGLQPEDLIGFEDTLYCGRPAVKIVYPDETGKPTKCIRYRLALDGEDRFRWAKDSKERLPFGLHWLPVARDRGELLIVEGETDAATAWVHDIPALGIPGATMAKVIAPEHLEGIRIVYAPEEPDQGGATFLHQLEQRLTSISWDGELKRIRLFWHDKRVKDLNVLHLIAGPEFEAAFEEARKHAETVIATDPFASGYTLSELMEMELPEPKWAIPELIPEGLSLLAGKPKRGKSFLCLGLGLAVASGGYALGKIKVEPRRALYLALEDQPKRLKARAERILQGEPAPERLHLFNRWPRLADGGLDLIAKWLERHPDTRIIMIDTLARVRSPTGGNSNIYELDYAALEGLQNLANAEGVAIIVVHHLRKQASDDPLDLVSGSFGLAASADTLLILRRGERQADAELYIAARDVEEKTLALKWDSLTTQWVLLGNTEEVKRSQQRNEILALLTEEGRPLTPKQVANLLQKNYHTTKRLLQKMKMAGELGVSDKGAYYPIGPVNSVTSVVPVVSVVPVTQNNGETCHGTTATLRSVTRNLLSLDANSGDFGLRRSRGSRIGRGD